MGMRAEFPTICAKLLIFSSVHISQERNSLKAFNTKKSKAAQMAGEVGFLRRRLSFAAVQGQSRLLLDRLQLLGDGAREAAGRRDRAQAARLAEANEMRAQHASLIIGRNIRRSGFGLLD